MPGLVNIRKFSAIGYAARSFRGPEHPEKAQDTFDIPRLRLSFDPLSRTTFPGHDGPTAPDFQLATNAGKALQTSAGSPSSSAGPRRSPTGRVPLLRAYVSLAFSPRLSWRYS